MQKIKALSPLKRCSLQLFSKEDGSNLVEIALMMPILLFILAAVIDFGRAYYVAIEVNSAAHAAALYGSQNPVNITLAAMEAAAQLDAADIKLDTNTATVGCECYDGSGKTTACAPLKNTCADGGNMVYYVQVNHLRSISRF